MTYLYQLQLNCNIYYAKMYGSRLILHISKMTPIYNLFTVKSPQKENALISEYWIKLEVLWTCVFA